MISGKTKVLALFGNPVSHSLSPAMHNAWIDDHGLDAIYVALPLAHEGAGDFLREIRTAGFLGANVTVPFKERAAAAADMRHGSAAQLRVANTLRWTPNRLEAFTTDGDGFVASLDEATPGWRETVKTALVVGAGGAARGVAQALPHDLGLLIANRSASRAEELAAQLPNAQVASWEDLPACFSRADLIINTTTLGMTGAPEFDWPLEHCSSATVVADIVYAPLETTLLRKASARGLRTVDGLGMLIHQGALAFEIWFGVKPDTKKARERLLKIIAEREA